MQFCGSNRILQRLARAVGGRRRDHYHPRLFTPVAPSWADDTGDAISGTVGTAIAPVTVPAADGDPAPTYAASGLPAGTRLQRHHPRPERDADRFRQRHHHRHGDQRGRLIGRSPTVCAGRHDRERRHLDGSAIGIPPQPHRRAAPAEADTPAGWTRRSPPNRHAGVWRCRRDLHGGRGVHQRDPWPAPTLIARDLFDLGELDHAGRHRHARARADRDRTR